MVTSYKHQKNWLRKKHISILCWFGMALLIKDLFVWINVGPQFYWNIKNWLVVYLPLWNIWKSVGIIIPNIWKIKVMFQTLNQTQFQHDFRPHTPWLRLPNWLGWPQTSGGHELKDPPEIFEIWGSWNYVMIIGLVLLGIFTGNHIVFTIKYRGFLQIVP